MLDPMRGGASGSIAALCCCWALGCTAADEDMSTSDGGSTSEDGSTSTAVSTSSGGTSAGPVTSDGTSPSTSGTSSTTDASASATTEDPSTTGDDTTGGDTAWLDVGWGLDDFTELEDDGAWPVHLGIQGLYMFTVSLRGSGFLVPADPTDVTDPDVPILDVWLDVDGVPPGGDGHSFSSADYPVPFEVDPDDLAAVQFVSLWMIFPDTVDPPTLQGNAIHVHAEMSTADGETFVIDRDLVVGEIIPP